MLALQQCATSRVAISQCHNLQRGEAMEVVGSHAGAVVKAAALMSCLEGLGKPLVVDSKVFKADKGQGILAERTFETIHN